MQSSQNKRKKKVRKKAKKATEQNLTIENTEALSLRLKNNLEKQITENVCCRNNTYRNQKYMLQRDITKRLNKVFHTEIIMNLDYY